MNRRFMKSFLTAILAGYALMPLVGAILTPGDYPLLSKLAFAAGGACILAALLLLKKPTARHRSPPLLAAGLVLEIVSSFTSLRSGSSLPFGVLLAVTVLLFLGFITYVYSE